MCPLRLRSGTELINKFIVLTVPERSRRDRTNYEHMNHEHTNIILYDDNCNLCKASVRFLTKHDTKHRLSFVPLNSTESRVALKNVGVNFVQKNTVYFIHQQKAYVKSSAVLKALSLLRFPVNILSVFIVVPRFIRDYFYGLVARNRTRF